MRFLLLPSLLLLSACGGMVSDAGDAGDASASDAPVGYDAIAKPDAKPPLLDAGGCNDVALLGADVAVQAVPQAAPTFPVGDPVPPPGTYALDSITLYTGQGGQSGNVGTTNVTLRIENDGITWQTASSRGGSVDHLSFQLGKGANGYVLTQTCGGKDTSPIMFPPINSAGFAILTSNAGVTALEVFRPFQK